MINKCIDIYKKNEEVVMYLIMGVLATIVNISVKYALLFTILNPKDAFELQVAVIISWIAAVLFAYTTNRKFVFKSKENNILKEFSSFIVARIITLIMEMIIMWFFITFLKLDTKLWVAFITLVAQALVIILNYIFSKLFIFKKENN